jgi:hypothetical protein
MPGYPWCCFCNTYTCAIFEDDFNRSNSATVGNGWVETDWSISGNYLVSGTTSIIQSMRSPLISQVAKVWWYLDTGIQVDDTWSILLRDGDIEVSFTCTATNGTIATFDVVGGGVTVEVADKPLGYWNVFTATLTGEGQLCVLGFGMGGTGNHILTACVTEDNSKRKVGLSAGQSGEQFNDFVYAVHGWQYTADLFPEDLAANCPSCDCTCEGICLPLSLEATIEYLSGPGECPLDPDGAEVSLTHPDTNGTGLRTVPTGPGSWSGTIPGYSDLVFRCASDDADQFSITMFGGTSNGDATESTCDPLNLVFYFDFSGCYYKVTITR